MADVALGVAGAIVGGIVGGSQGALLGWSAGTLVGGALWGPKAKAQNIGKLDDVQRKVSGSAYGTPIPIVYGKDRVGGNVIWATDLEETSIEVSAGGKGSRRRTNKKYVYKGNFAVLFCKGPKRILRVWFEDRLVWDAAAALGGHTIRIYDGDEVQGKDTLISSIMGAANTPAYRGHTYLVGEEILLEQWGNRIPGLISAEVDDVP